MRTQEFLKTNISNPLTRTCTCAYQGETNVSLKDIFTKWIIVIPLIWNICYFENFTPEMLLTTFPITYLCFYNVASCGLKPCTTLRKQ